MKSRKRIPTSALMFLIITAAVCLTVAGAGVLNFFETNAFAQGKKGEKSSKSKKKFPCDPIFISGITGRCTGTGDPKGFAGEAFQFGKAPHPIALDPELTQLPLDRFGLVDWADALKSGAVKPQHSLNPDEKDSFPIDMDVVIFTKSKFQPDVLFPHKIHTMWLTCTNCHPAIFPMNAVLANKVMHMTKIAAGEFCGRCHNRIAFPLSDCLRCHIKPRNVPPIDPDGDKWGIVPIQIPE